MFDFITDKTLRNHLIKVSEEIIHNVQKELKPFFTFSYKLIGSGDSRLMMKNGNDNSIDLDYNLEIQRIRTDLLGQTGFIKKSIMDALREASEGEYKVKDSTSVITCSFKDKINGYKFSIDFAILMSSPNGKLCKLINDKRSDGTAVYIWNEIPKSIDFQYKFKIVKQEYNWNDIKDNYKRRKNINLKNNSPKSSFSLLIETVNELYNKL